jgi:hypothetical protein
MLLIEDGFHFIDQRPDSRLFLRRCLEVFGDMPPHDNKAVPGVYGVAVVMGERQLVFDNDFGLSAKGAVLVFGHAGAFLAVVADEPASCIERRLNPVKFLAF